MKRNLLILVIILLIGFITNSCSDDENGCSICKNGQHCNTHCVIENCPVHDCKNHSKSACDVCNPKCKCPEGTIHFIGDTMECISEINCNCEHGNFSGARVQGFAVTNRQNVENVEFDVMIEKINTALTHADFASEVRQAFIKGNIIEIRVIPAKDGEDPTIIEGVLIVENTVTAVAIRRVLRTWCEANNK